MWHCCKRASAIIKADQWVAYSQTPNDRRWIGIIVTHHVKLSALGCDVSRQMTGAGLETPTRRKDARGDTTDNRLQSDG